jgi:hypothetical protein
MAAAANNAWRDLLVHCGIPQAGVSAFNVVLGANDINTLLSLPLDELKRDLETIGKNQANVNLISTVASKRLMALRTWVEYKLLHNEQMAALDDSYLSLDADLYMMANLEEAQYHDDNARVFGLLKVWLCHTVVDFYPPV